MDRIKNGLVEGQVPVISQVVRIIREISEKADSMSVQDLADIISQDPSTMNRILSIAGTLGYNPGGVEITSMRQAVALVGFERIRNLAISVMLLENVEQHCSAETNRELAALSLSGGLLAAGLCAGSRDVEPDLAFLCGALRSYGRMLMATFMAEEYADAMTTATGDASSDEALQGKFGLTPLDLGRELLGSMQMPPMILKTLQEIPEPIRARLAESPSGNLMLAAELGLKLADVLANRHLEPEDFERQLASVTRGYPDRFALSPKEAGNLVRDVVSRINTFNSAGKLSTGRVTLFARLESLAEGRPPPPPFRPRQKKGRGTEIITASGTAPASRAQAPGAVPKTVLAAAREDLNTLLQSSRPDAQRAFGLVVQAMQNAFDLESCLLFVRAPDGTVFRLVASVGPNPEPGGGQPVIKTGQRDVFGVPLLRGEDVMIQNPDEPRMRAFVPEWLRPPGRSLPFMLLPLKDAQGTFSLVCGICRSPKSFARMNEAVDELRQLRSRLADAGALVRSLQP